MYAKNNIEYSTNSFHVEEPPFAACQTFSWCYCSPPLQLHGGEINTKHTYFSITIPSCLCFDMQRQSKGFMLRKAFRGAGNKLARWHQVELAMAA